MINLSLRMQAIADMVTEKESVADIGCDHGFVAIYLAQSKGVKKVYALDVNEGPLLRAKEHIDMNNLCDVIETRLSDGAKALNENEAKAAIIAGMGGKLIARILNDSQKQFRAMNEVILSPHSEIPFVREYLCMEGYSITDEDMVYDEEKYYQIIKCKYTGEKYSLDEEEKLYGPVNITKKNLVLQRYLKETADKKEAILQKLKKQIEVSAKDKVEGLALRVSEIEKEIAVLEKVSKKY